jgi:hypothetical protein
MIEQEELLGGAASKPAGREQADAQLAAGAELPLVVVSL